MGKKSKRNRPNQSQQKPKDNKPISTTTMGNTTSSTTETTTSAPAAAAVAVAKEVAVVTETKEEEPSFQLPSGLKDATLTESQSMLVMQLCSQGQEHLFQDVATASIVLKQLETLDLSYPTGLRGYLNNAIDLLEQSRQGVNPLHGWKPSVPRGETFHLGTHDFDETEAIGLQYVGKCGFVLVAGGLGERLGYGDIKIGLPTELATRTCYIEFFIQTILAIQHKYANNNIKLPLCIMTSNDTNTKTVALLETNNYFGMDKDQITIVQQGQGVPALENNNARIAVGNNGETILTKPHGHGDVHALLYSNHVVKSWLNDIGLEYVVFFQDTNGLAFHTLPLALGVSRKLNLVMNSLAVPRKAKQAIGGIAQLTNEKGDQRTVNVEYNQLDPLLRSSGFPEGDVNDPSTGYSPFPGNINQLLFALGPYVEALERTKGAMPEFVNPKYKDASKMDFKSPTRLECMMQDFPVVLDGETAKRVGFTCVDADICFSPVKNAVSDGVALQEKGISPGVAASGEADQYGAQAKICRSIGCVVGESTPHVFHGISVQLSPTIVLKPNFVTFPAEYKAKFPFPSLVEISARSSLVVEGGNVIIKSLDLDGALVIKCEEGAPMGTIDGLVVSNQGWVFEKEEDETTDEVIRMRGYRLNKLETCTIVFKQDGTVEGLPKNIPPVSKSTKPPEDLTRPSSATAADTTTCGCSLM